MKLTNSQLDVWRNKLLKIASSAPLSIDELYLSLDDLGGGVPGNGSHPAPPSAAAGTDEELEAAIVTSFMEALDAGPEAAFKRVSLDRGKLASGRRQDEVIRKWIVKLSAGPDGWLDMEGAFKDLESRLFR